LVGDEGGINKEGIKGNGKALHQFIGRLGDKNGKPISFEPQPQPFNRIEVGTLRRQEARHKVMPMELTALVP
jgi:hypothetical protein